MNQKRQAKLKKRADEQHRRSQKKHDLATTALRHADLYQLFLRFPPKLREKWLNVGQPPPEIVLHASATGCQGAQTFQEMFPPCLRAYATQRDLPVNPLELYCYLLPFHLQIEALTVLLQQRKFDLRSAPWCDVVELAARLKEYMQQHRSCVENDLVVMIWSLLLYESEVDERMLWYQFSQNAVPGGRAVLQVVVHRTKPERLTLLVDERPRPAFRCYVPNLTGGITEVAWKGIDLGFPDDPQEYPVYMQSHALEQVRRRCPCSRIVYPITMSLIWPKFLPGSRGHFLVEFRHMKDKLGYFVAVRLEGRILLKTFLFLTMQGTPESDLLYHKLHLTRRDIEYLKLDELAAFRDPEVRNDPALVKLLNDCGCGHLLTLTAPDLPQEIPTGYAEPLRKYLGTNDKSLIPMPVPTINATPDDLHP